MAPAEGWPTLLLHATLVVATAWTMERAAGAPGRTVLVVAALGGLLVGFGLAKLRPPDLLAHLIAFSGGVGLAFGLAVARVDPLLEGWRDRLRFQWEMVLDWYRRLLSSGNLDDPHLFAAVVALTVWLVAYTSGWVLYRRGWLTTALVVPGVIAVVNLGYAPAGPAPLILFVVAACLMAARHHLYRRERDWAHARMARPRRLRWHFLGAGANLALLVAVLTWSLPLGARELVATAVWQRLEEPWGSTVARLEELAADLPGPRRSGASSYASFDDEFRLGGRLNLSDEPAAVLRPNPDTPGRPTYLVGRRYNVYDGRGWSSDAPESFAPADDQGRGYSSQMSFAAGLGVHLSPSLNEKPTTTGGEIELLRPKGKLLLTTDTFLTADRKFNVELSWEQVTDRTYDLTGDSLRVVLARLPVDLRAMTALLWEADFGTALDPTPRPSDRRLAAEVAAERTKLAGRFLDVRWRAGPDGRVSELIVSGQLPVYDDVEAVFSGPPVEANERYGVTGLASTADPDELRAAGTDYPSWVADRYLELPPTVTERTRALAAELGGAGATPFDVAQAAEDYVRRTIRYEENIEAPPSDQDVVDYVLFESQEGYCEYYASAMAVLLRAEGIPARVAGGYFAVPWDDDQGGFLYREKNAHLWVEVFFPNYGWIPFEPTANRSEMNYGDVQPETAATPVPTPAPEPTPDLGVATPAAAAGIEPPNDGGGRFAGGTGGLGWWTLVIGGRGGLGLLAGAATWAWGLRGLTPAAGLYARSVRLGRWLGVAASPATTPAEYADRLGRVVPTARHSARVVSDYYSHESFAPRPADAAAAARARAAWSELRRTAGRAMIRRRGAVKQRRNGDG